MRALYDLPAPAKLNLFLHVIGHRADGYHLLQSVFMLIDWCDTLHFELRSDGQLSREDLATALPMDDLTLRAARALQSATACTAGVHIGIAKRVPSQAGMGGGSSDAATCLLALNHLWGLHLPLSALTKIGLQLGADIPFFLHGHNAWVEGTGELITPLNGLAALPPERFAVLKPASGLDTGRIFSATELKRDSKPATIAGFAANQKEFRNSARNDLYGVARQLCPDLDFGLVWLGSQGLSGR
ncbi:MAG: 4-diphosphocytidyl-2-C-methyl-D-erythritol kinase, partial [Pseudomonadota bacterium]